MRKFFIASAFLVASLFCKAQENVSPEVADLVAISDYYKSLNSLELEVSYRVYGDTLGKSVMDSSTERFISYNGNTYDNHLNTVSIVKDSLVFFIDHERKMAYLDRKPILNNTSLTDRIQQFLNQRGGFKRYGVGDGKYKYHVTSDNILYDWIEIYIDTKSKRLDKVVYRFSDGNETAKGAKLMVIEFRKQSVGKQVSSSRFNLETYLTIPKSGTPALVSKYHNYKFYSYL